MKPADLSDLLLTLVKADEKLSAGNLKQPLFSLFHLINLADFLCTDFGLMISV